MMKLSVTGRWLLAFVLVGLAARLAVAVASGLNAPPFPPPDAILYDSLAWNMAQGKGYRGNCDVLLQDVPENRDRVTAFVVPGAQMVWAGLYWVFGHHPAVVRLSQCVVGALTILPLFGIGRRCFGERVGLFAAGVYAVYPTALLIASQFQTEVLGTFWFLCFLLACLRFAERPSIGRSVLAGVLLGVSMLTRSPIAIMMPLVGVWILWQFFGRWRELTVALLIPAAALATLLPWTIRNYVVFGRFVPLGSSRATQLLVANNMVAVTNQMWAGYSVPFFRLEEYNTHLRPLTHDEFLFDQKCGELAIRWLRENPDKWWYLIRTRQLRGWSPLLQPHVPLRYRLGMLASWTPVLVLFLVAFVPTLVKFLRERSPGWLIHLGILHVSLAFIAFPAVKRYRYPVEPLCIILACVALVWLWDRWRRRMSATT